MTKWKVEEGVLVKVDEFFHPKDNILDDITFEDLMDTIYSNEKIIDNKTVERVFEEILKQRVRDARYEVKTNMKEILSSLKKMKDDN